MSDDKFENLILYTDESGADNGAKVVADLIAHRIVICSQYADLRDEHDKLIATITWTTPVKCRKG